MTVTRRTLLKYGLYGTVGTLGITSGHLYFNNEDLKPAPEREGKVLCDIHTHPTDRGSLDDTLDVLGSPGLVGLTAKKHKETTGGKILTYEKTVALLKDDKDFQEITPGQLASYKAGYFARTHEFSAGIHHVLAMGWEGELHPPYETIEQAVHEVHERQGIAILCHPFVVAGGLLFRIPGDEEKTLLRKAYELVDAVEIHDAQNINLFPVIASMKKANTLATELAGEYPHLPQIAASDCHRDVRQMKICGIYVDKDVIEEQGMDGLKQAIREGNFERYGDHLNGPYVSRASWLNGMIAATMLGY